MELTEKKFARRDFPGRHGSAWQDHQKIKFFELRSSNISTGGVAANRSSSYIIELQTDTLHSRSILIINTYIHHETPSCFPGVGGIFLELEASHSTHDAARLYST